jgi:hypothetical protein
MRRLAVHQRLRSGLGGLWYVCQLSLLHRFEKGGRLGSARRFRCYSRPSLAHYPAGFDGYVPPAAACFSK